MNDLYQRLDKNPSRKVTPRTNDGFTDSNCDRKHNFANSQESVDAAVSPDLSLSTPQPQQTEYLVETSKSKLLTLEVGVRKDLDQILFEHKDVSWDTVLEAALITCLNNPTAQKRFSSLLLNV